MPASINQLAHALGIDPSDRDTRALAACIVASLVLHAAVLLLFPGLREGRPAASPSMVLSARIALKSEFPERPEIKPETRAVPPLPPPVEVPRPVLTVPTPAPVAPRIAETAPVPVPVPPPVQATPPAQAAPAPQPAASAAAPAAPAPPRAAEGPAPAAQTEGVDQGTLDRFRMEILAATRRYRRYPAQAMEKGWQGKVEISLAIGANGVTQSYVIKTSSGFQLLDETALDMVKKGRPWVQIPPSLRGREFVVDVPVIFDLKSG